PLFPYTTLFRSDADADQALAEQHTVRGAPRLERGHIGVGGGRAVVGAKDWIGARGGVEARLHVRRRDRPAGARLMAAHAGATIGPETLEKGSRAVDLARR